MQIYNIDALKTSVKLTEFNFIMQNLLQIV